MTTTTAAPAAKPKRKRKTKRFIVEKDGVPCVLQPTKEFGPSLVPRGGVLVRTDGPPSVFRGEKSALRAISRAWKVQRFLSMKAAGWSRHAELRDFEKLALKPTDLPPTVGKDRS